MVQRYLIIIDEQPQSDRLLRIESSLKKDGIELIYQEINPKLYGKRQSDGDMLFDEVAFTQALIDIPFVHHLDVFATDYNLIDKLLKGIDVISIVSEIKSFYSKRVVIYSAQMDGVFGDILTRENEPLDDKISKLKLLSRYDVDYLSSDGEFETKFKSMIEKEPNITIDSRLIECMKSIDSEKIVCTIPPFDKMTLPEVAKLMMSKDPNSIKLRKEITDHIMACITKFENYE